MKISSSQMFRKFSKWSLSLSFMVLISGSIYAAGPAEGDQAGEPAAENAGTQIDGGALFALKCAKCHSPHKESTGPKLFHVRDAWEAEGAGDVIFLWVRDFNAAVSQNSYAAAVEKKKPGSMEKFPDLTDDQITAIFDWVDAQPEPGAAVPGAAQGGGEEVVDNSSSFWIWLILGVIFIAIILAVGGVRRQLQIATGEKSDEGLSYTEELKGWMWKYKRYMSLVGLVAVLAVIVVLFQSLYSINVMEDYHPDQPIAFPHDVHAGKNGIDCKYCHNSVEKSKTAGLPTVNVCMNCHKKIEGSTDAQKEQIKKIYEAAGWNGNEYTGVTKPIVWNKVHNLPDHVFFSHKQHVKVGGVDCMQCHGDMTKRNETAKVMPVAELNEIDGNIKLTRPTLTMGWCIECHDQKEISNGPLADDNADKHSYYDEIHKRLLNNDKSLYAKYLEDGKVTVKELGGWECSKCHY